MPLYTFQKFTMKDGERVFEEKFDERYYPLSDFPKWGFVHTDEKGDTWARVYVAGMQIISNVIKDPNNAAEFVEKTRNKKGSVGDLLDQAKELSEKRAQQNGGVDPLQKKYFEDYKKKRNGVEHLEKKKQTFVDKENFTISYK